MITCLYYHTVFASRLSNSRDSFQEEKTDSRFTLDLLSTCHIWTRNNYPNFVMFFNFKYSLNLFDMYVKTNLYLFYCFDIV